MPNLARLRQDGARGRLQPSEPMAPHTAWATLATGREPVVHGVLAPRVPRPDGGGVMAAGHNAWKAPPFWRLLEAAGRSTITVGWPNTAPAQAWPGIHVDSRFATPTGPGFDTWAVPRHAVSPAALLPVLRPLRVHPADIEGAMLAPFVPGLMQIDQYRDASLSRLAVLLAGASTLHAAATALIEQQPWDVAAVHYGWLDGIQRSFLAEPAGSRLGGIVDAAYGFADAMLGRLMHLAGEETTIWVVSPMGVRGGAGQAMTRAGAGFIAARGRWIEASTKLAPARLVDIAPSLLARFGLVAETDGKPIFALAPGQSRRPVVVPQSAAPAPERHAAALKTLGYDDTPSPAQSAALTLAEAEALIGRGEALLAAGRLHEAEAALLAARAILPPDSPAGLQRLALCRLMRNDAAGSRRIGETLLRIAPLGGWGDVIVAAGHALEGDAAAARPHMIAAEAKGGREPDLLNRLGGVALLLNDDVTATAHFLAALSLDPDMEAARRGLALAREMAALAERRPDSA
jgi:tetratricopeptide (TPR) repeat protein